MEIFKALEIQGQTDLWRILATTAKTQVAVMVLAEGQVSGEYGTDHPQADQVLYCVSGLGSVEREGESVSFGPGDVALIPAGARHQVRGGPCITLNVYGPPAYSRGD